MDRERLKKLAGDERFIPGIYNYCDRWRERCSQTLRFQGHLFGQDLTESIEEGRQIE